MVVAVRTCTILGPLLRNAYPLNTSHNNVIRTLSTHKHSLIIKHISQRRFQFEIIRSYGEWAPNIVRSPYPDFIIPDQLYHECIWSKQQKWSELTALVCGLTGREIKYGRLRQLCRRLATSLLKEGLKPGQVISVVLPNMPEFPVVAFGTIESGLILSPINPVYTADEIAYQVNNSGAVAVITFPGKLDTVIEAVTLLNKENQAASNIRIICTPDVRGEEIDLPEGVIRFSELVGDSIESELSSLQTHGRSNKDVAIIPYSSGTTGRPKGVCLTHSNLIASTFNTKHANDIQETTNGVQEIIPCILPGFHIYGFTLVMGVSLFNGGKLVLLPRFEEKSFLDVLINYKPTVLYVAPPLVIYIGTSPNVTKEHLQTLKLIITGAAPCSDTDIHKCIEKSPSISIYKQGYGMTETSPTICYMSENSSKYSSVGAPAANTIIKVADLQTHQPLGPDEEGEICVKGSQVMKGYLNNEEANAEVFDSEGWFHTGDIGYYDQDKHFYITDRLKELIKVKGFQVAPAELEAVLRSHPDIEDAGVIGIPDTRKGETPVAFIKTKNGVTPSTESLKEFMAQKVAKFKQIDIFVFVEAIPKSAAGKILRKDLRERILKDVNLESYLKEKLEN